MEDYLTYVQSEKCNTSQFKDTKDLVKDVPNLVKEDKTFSNFRKRVAIEPEQVNYIFL